MISGLTINRCCWCHLCLSEEAETDNDKRSTINRCCWYLGQAQTQSTCVWARPAEKDKAKPKDKKAWGLHKEQRADVKKTRWSEYSNRYWTRLAVPARCTRRALPQLTSWKNVTVSNERFHRTHQPTRTGQLRFGVVDVWPERKLVMKGNVFLIGTDDTQCHVFTSYASIIIVTFPATKLNILHKGHRERSKKKKKKGKGKRKKERKKIAFYCNDNYWLCCVMYNRKLLGENI